MRSLLARDRSGSHAGRGFRYQDAVTAWLAVRSWTDPLLRGIVIPEGGDDVERRTATGRRFIQIKSRRAHLGALPVAEARDHVKALWERHDHAASPPETLELIVERAIVGLEAERAGNISIAGQLDRALSASPRARSMRAKTAITHVPAPLQDAVASIVKRMGCSPLAAALCFSQLLVAVGTFADENGRRAPDEYVGLSPGDAESIILETLAAVDDAKLERAIREGACEPVDFLTALPDPNFYAGVDAQPGHVVAGLVLPRIEPREALIEGLKTRRAALIAGPSGAGKSAIMWETAFSLRHTIRWYRLMRVDQRDLASLRQLARALRASTDSPIGLVVDDIGRRGAEGWDALTLGLQDLPGVLLLGSIREEDLFLLHGRSRALEVRAEPDEQLAQRLYEELRQDGRTKWPGWREPWRLSEGLILEYGYILTAGRRFEETLAEQVAQRQREPARSTELAALRIVSMAGAAGVVVDASSLPRLTGTSDDEVSRGLRRLVDEHLIQASAVGRLTGLHQLRSAELVRLTHEVPPPSVEATFALAVQAVLGPDLEPLTADAVAIRGVAPASAVQALANRITANPDIEALGAGLRGLATARIAAAVEEWLARPIVQELPRTQIGSAAMFGVSGIGFPDLGQPTAAAEAAAILTTIKNDSAGDPRQDLLATLPTDLIAQLVRSAPNPASLNRLLSSLIGMPLAQPVRNALSSPLFDLLATPLYDTAGLLGTLAAFDRPLAVQWVDEAGADLLIGRIPREVAWAAPPEFEQAQDGLVVRSDYRMAGLRLQEDEHGATVRICELALALAPRADIAASRALAPNGAVAGFMGLAVSEKRILRANLPSAAVPAWNRRWRDEIASRVATDSYSDYLARGAAMANCLVPVLERIFDSLLRGRGPAEVQLDRLGDVHTEAQTLTPPRLAAATVAGKGDGEPNRHVTKFQNILFQCSADLVRRFAKLPDGAGAYIGWLRELISDCDAALSEEPWNLVGQAPESLERLREILTMLQAMAGEAQRHGAGPIANWLAPASKAAPGKALRIVGRLAVQQVQRSRDAFAREIRERAAQAGIHVDIRVRPDPSAILPWPPSEVLALPTGDNVDAAFIATMDVAPRMRDLIDPMVRLTVAPSVAGQVMPELALSGYETLLPHGKEIEEWLAQAELPAFRPQVLTALDRAIDVASGLQSLDRLGLGLPGRPRAEQDARLELEIEFEELIARFDHLAQALEPALAKLGREMIERVRSGEFPFIDTTQATLEGELPDEIANLGALRLTMAQWELKNPAV